MLNKELPISNDKVIELVQAAVLHAPSAFNSQSSRAVVLLGAEHTKLWDEFARPALKAVLPEAQWASTEGRLNLFTAAAGTVLLFEDEAPVQALQQKLPAYAEHFPSWSEQAHGIVAAYAWSALAQEKIGGNLQHYQFAFADKVTAEYKLPESWKLKAQLVFGGIGAPAGEKAFQPIEDRVKAFGA